MARPLTKTSITTLKMTPEVRARWERCAAEEHRTLSNMFEVMVYAYAKSVGIDPSAPEQPSASRSASPQAPPSAPLAKRQRKSP